MVAKRFLVAFLCLGLLVGGGTLFLPLIRADSSSGAGINEVSWYGGMTNRTDGEPQQAPDSAEITATVASSPTPASTPISVPTDTSSFSFF